jgi:hypothetical protein
VLWYFIWVFLVTRPFRGYQKFYLVILTLIFDLLIKNFSLGYIFWMVCTTTLIFHMSIPCNKIFVRVQKKIDLVTLTLVFYLLFEIVTLAMSLDWYIPMLWYFIYESFLRQDFFMGTQKFDFETFTLVFDLLIKKQPVRIRVRVGFPHSLACPKRWLNGAFLRMRPEPRPRVTAGVAW